MSAASLERDFDGRTALVTGGAGGIGLAIARQLAEGGARVVLLDLERQALDVAAASLAEPRHHLALAVDVTRPEGVEQAVATVLEATGRIDILINSAGVALLEPAGEVSEAAWERTLAVNLTAPLLLAQAVAPAMRRQRHGRIINLASQASVVAAPAPCRLLRQQGGPGGTDARGWRWSGRRTASPSTPSRRRWWTRRWAARPGPGRWGRPCGHSSPRAALRSPRRWRGWPCSWPVRTPACLTGENIVIDGGYSIQ